MRDKGETAYYREKSTRMEDYWDWQVCGKWYAGTSSGVTGRGEIFWNEFRADGWEGSEETAPQGAQAAGGCTAHGDIGLYEAEPAVFGSDRGRQLWGVAGWCFFNELHPAIRRGDWIRRRRNPGALPAVVRGRIRGGDSEREQDNGGAVGQDGAVRVGATDGRGISREEVGEAGRIRQMSRSGAGCRKIKFKVCRKLIDIQSEAARPLNGEGRRRI